MQETLIVWSESDTCDLALSFQEKSGCEEIWAKICEVQGKDPGDAVGFEKIFQKKLSLKRVFSLYFERIEA